MARGFALLVGLKGVNPATYGGWNGQNGCTGCELDVDNVKNILSPLGFQLGVLKTEQATSSNILAALQGAARYIGQEDIFVFYFAGHGGQQPDLDGDEADSKDETLVSYDREIIDDELNKIWPTFRSGSRIVMISDSCNSGSNYRMMRSVAFEKASAIRMFSATRDRNNTSVMKAQMIHYGACRDGGTSAGYSTGGAFTTALCRAWANGGFTGSYKDLYSRILADITGEPQQPQYNEYGPVSAEFRNQRPFTIIPAGVTASSLPIPTREEISSALATFPVAWLYQPSLIKTGNVEQSVARIDPLTAAAVGVVVGAGIQIVSKALSRAVTSRSSELPADFKCNLPYSTIKQLAGDFVTAARSDNEMAENLRKIAAVDTGRVLPVVVVAFLAGVTVGAAAARP